MSYLVPTSVHVCKSVFLGVCVQKERSFTRDDNEGSLSDAVWKGGDERTRIARTDLLVIFKCARES